MISGQLIRHWVGVPGRAEQGRHPSLQGWGQGPVPHGKGTF
jgi:hypothetical protein